MCFRGAHQLVALQSTPYPIYKWAVTRQADGVVIASGEVDKRGAKEASTGRLYTDLMPPHCVLQNNCDATMAQMVREGSAPKDMAIAIDIAGMKVGAVRDSSQVFLGTSARQAGGVELGRH